MGVPVAVDSTDDRPDGRVQGAGSSSPPWTPPAARFPRRRGGAPQTNVVVVLVVGALITAGLSLGAHALHNSNEDRLLKQRVREVGVVITAAIPSVETPLASAAVLAGSTSGSPEAFKRLMSPSIKAKLFQSVSLWPAASKTPRPLAFVGARPELTRQSEAEIRALFARTAAAPKLAINNLLAARDRRLGFAYRVSKHSRFVVYAESRRPEQRRAAVDSNEAFAELDYAFYLGTSADPRYLLASSNGGESLHGRRESITVPFGDSQLLIVMSPRTELGGVLLARLWWLLALFGMAITLGAASLVGRLSQRRRDAERLAIENARLYAEQRSVAQTLQHSLLAEAFPEVPELEFSARYVAGVEGIDIGGDWYDVVRVDRDHIMMVVGDVSGRGLEAATMMASLRYAARAYAAESHTPATILTKLSGLTSVARDGHFATVLCAALEVATGRVIVANAGHPAPLLVTPVGASFIETDIGVPVGVDSDVPYREVEFTFAPGSTLLLYTDGAVERRGERLDTGMQRLQDLSPGVGVTLESFLDAIVNRVRADGAEDDTAMLGVRWRTRP